MNTKKYIIIAICVALGCVNCSDFLEESNPNKIPAETFYQTEENILFAANGAYAALRGAGFYRDMYIYTDIR